ncbi:656_t:CDS:2, partial [Ambispora leptoticha]
NNMAQVISESKLPFIAVKDLQAHLYLQITCHFVLIAQPDEIPERDESWMLGVQRAIKEDREKQQGSSKI